MLTVQRNKAKHVIKHFDRFHFPFSFFLSSFKVRRILSTIKIEIQTECDRKTIPIIQIETVNAFDKNEAKNIKRNACR